MEKKGNELSFKEYLRTPQINIKGERPMKNNFKGKNLLILFLIVIIFLITVIFIKDKEVSDAKGKDNLNGLIFPQVCSLDSKFIYYINFKDNSVYKINKSGTGRTKIFEGIESSYGMILKDDFIYYIGGSSGYLHRVKNDGTGDIKIDQINIDRLDCSFEMINNSIFYRNKAGDVYSISEDGKKHLNHIFNMDNITLNSYVLNNILYSAQDDGIYMVDIEDGGVKKISNDVAYSKLKIVDNYIYYINNADKKLYRMNIQGKDRSRVNDDIIVTEGADFDSGDFCITGGRIYYTQNSFSGCSLCTIDMNGNDKKVLAKDVFSFIIGENKIYYTNNTDNGVLYSMNFDGSDKISLTSNSFIPFLKYGESVLVYGAKALPDESTVEGRIFMIGVNGDSEIELR